MTLTIARRVPVVWDLSGRVRLPDMGRRRLAHAVRQDLWRALQRLRGFAPVVAVTRDGQGVTLRAGGAVSGAVPGAARARLDDMLSDPVRHAAWLRAARHRQCTGG
ncbi:hypothetical protein [Jannaschia pohangensis]|uniref:hypothetical protein n=1 Tax=Jannaschia pohangensis TaxID=390807 RepID=UPI001FE1FBCB|nr:hypothetical protein [Jannaschia pohangensis]